MLCRMVLLTKKKKKGAVPVYLNVYDLTPMNGYAYWFCLGVYHSGVQGDVTIGGGRATPIRPYGGGHPLFFKKKK
jgi:hypothetical protein